MAILKCLSAKGTVKNILKYVTNKEKTEEKIISGQGCCPETAYEEMTATKLQWGKTEGIQYFHIIQSFKPGEVSPEKAHAIALEFAANQLKGYECIIATHIDKEHIHNHIVLNSVNQENGKKYHSTKQTLLELKKENNHLCEREKLSTIDLDKRAAQRITSGELRKVLRGETCWKDELREAIDKAKTYSNSLEELKENLRRDYNIQTKIQNKNIKYLHPGQKQYIGGQKLGNDYNKEELNYGFNQRTTKNIRTETIPSQPTRSGTSAAAGDPAGAFHLFFRPGGNTSRTNDHDQTPHEEPGRSRIRQENPDQGSKGLQRNLEAPDRKPEQQRGENIQGVEYQPGQPSPDTAISQQQPQTQRRRTSAFNPEYPDRIIYDQIVHRARSQDDFWSNTADRDHQRGNHPDINPAAEPLAGTQMDKERTDSSHGQSGADRKNQSWGKEINEIVLEAVKEGLRNIKEDKAAVTPEPAPMKLRSEGIIREKREHGMER